MNIAIFETKPWEQDMFKKELKGQKITFFKEPIQKVPLKKFKNTNVITSFITSKIDAKIIKELPNLKLIATRSTGFDHIDLKQSTAQKVKVVNVPTYGENTVAEHAFALILNLSRNVFKSYLRSLKKDYSIEGLKGFDLQDKTIGVVGCGHIGLHLIRIARGFGMDVLVYDINRDKFLSETLNFKYVGLNELLKKSDVISMHLPYCKATHHIINKKNIKLIKKGAILINTARGGLVDTSALIEALDKKILRGIGLDVLEGENLLLEEHHMLHREKSNNKEMAMLIKDHKLLAKDNVIYTPHIAFYSQEAVDRITKTTIENIKSFIKGKTVNEVKAL
ncbi:MAG: NAD(P)-binding domain-containing protein [Candidatus Falkowbacteria bacterium]|nr:NAD(P)-binding domain-containing protein [Candidatus Falkowbacteria bacterium]